MKIFEFQNEYYNNEAIARVNKSEDLVSALPYIITLTYTGGSHCTNHFFKSKEERDNAWTDLIAEL